MCNRRIIIILFDAFEDNDDDGSISNDDERLEPLPEGIEAPGLNLIVYHNTRLLVQGI